MQTASDSKPIKRVIKHRQTGQYYAGPGRWSADPDQARSFENVLDLFKEAREQNLKESCVIVLKFNGSQYDIELPL